MFFSLLDNQIQYVKVSGEFIGTSMLFYNDICKLSII